MTRAASLSTRLPGLRFEVVQPQRPDALPRMDIAAFVGFAANGPMHVPVLVEDTAQFESIFGKDLPLAWDAERGEQEYAYLAPAVRAFFRNGGRRAWVIRVAGETAHTAWFPIPGLARFDGDDLLPAFAPARSPGAWGDALRVGASLLSQTVDPLGPACFDPVAKTLDLFLETPDQVVVGDVLRVTRRQDLIDQDPDHDIILFPVSKLESLESVSRASVPGVARRVRVSAENLFWLRPAGKKQPPSTQANLTIYNHMGKIATVIALLPNSGEWPDRPEAPVTFKIKSGQWTNTFKNACLPGVLIRADFAGGEPLWMLVDDCVVAIDTLDLRLSGQGVWQVGALPVPGMWGSPALTERLNLELWVQQPGQPLRRQSELGFAAGNPRFWAALPGDEELFSAQALAATGDSSFGLGQENPARSSVWQSAQAPRFPLAGPGESKDIFLPLIMAIVPKTYTGPDEAPGDTLVSDGLDRFSAALFLDPALADLGAETLLDRADVLRYTGAALRPLRGIHAALSIDEVTLIAAPDAAQLGWYKPPVASQPAPQPIPPLERPAWWHFLPCDPPREIPRDPQPKWGQFLACDTRVVPAPVLSITPADASGSFTLTWTVLDEDAEYILEESSFPGFSDAREIYRIFCKHDDNERCGRCNILGYSQGDYYYRVRIKLARPDGGADSTDWSNGVGIRIAPGTSWQTILRKDYDSDALRTVQLDLLRMCAARGDMFAVLSIPGHFREQESIDYVLRLRSPFAPAISVEAPVLELPGVTTQVSVAPIGVGEARSLSFGALYHPWFYNTDTEEDGSAIVHLVPPDGHLTGILAQRAHERGAWVAPANQPMRGVVALSPLIAPARWLDLQQAHINLVRQEPQGFVTLSENTLSDDPDWRLVNVRRLISLLRRLAQRYGPTWVFEPNDQAFARLVKRTFTSLLDQMFARGAFAGSRPETSYQVIIRVTPKDIDEGRFVVELRVAPSLPMRFITIRLVQSGERSLVTEGG